MDNVFTVAEFNKVMNGFFGDLGEFSVTGEVTQMRISQNGAVFIELKDKKENALLKLSNYGPKISGLKSISEGMEVTATGYPEIYSPYGTFSLKPRIIQPMGEGALKQAFENLKAALEVQGYFNPDRKRQLPEYISRIALITGKGSAAFADFTRIMADNSTAIEIDFYPVLVQGEKSPSEIVGAIEMACMSDVDVVVLIRGGGSLEDLQAFNSESVAKAIFNSRVPVIVGVGHEVDISIADLVADLRAATPTHAAYHLVSQNNNLLEQVRLTAENMYQALFNSLNSDAEVYQITDLMESRLLQKMPSELEIVNKQRLLQVFLQRYQLTLESLAARVKYAESCGIDAMTKYIAGCDGRLQLFSRLIGAYSPRGVLDRGYALVQRSGRYTASAGEIAVDDEITITLKDGQIESKVTKKINSKLSF